MSDPIRMRAKLKDGVTEMHVLMPHPMETGFRKDESGQLVPAHYITDVQVSLAGREVLSARMGLAVSQDPLLSFRFRGAQPGDAITVTWTDNRGDQRMDRMTLS